MFVLCVYVLPVCMYVYVYHVCALPAELKKKKRGGSGSLKLEYEL